MRAASKKFCRCGRAEKRAGQRNCKLCNAEANARYHTRLKAEKQALEKSLRQSSKTFSLLVQILS